MPPQLQSPSLASILVARFLRTNNYNDTLAAFIREAGLPVDAGQIGGKDDWTIESVLEEKKAFDATVRFERYGEDNEEDGLWSSPAPSKPSVVQTPSSSNLLSCSVEPWQELRDGDRAEMTPSYVVATGADRQLYLFETTTGNETVRSFFGHSDSPILSYVSVQNGKYVVMTNMSGQLLLQRGTEILDRRKDHAKYAVKVVSYETHDADSTVWLATAGWDAKVFLYRLRLGPDADGPVSLADSVAYIPLASNPESLLFVRHPDTNELILLVSRRDSTYLYYYEVESATPPSPPPSSSDPGECPLLGRQNLAPHSNAWVAFSPSCLALSPHDPRLLAVATSTQPHMKVLIVRMLFPTRDTLDLVTSGPVDTATVSETQATQALAALSLQNREDAAILIQANTFAPQTAYSTPQVVWRPDGSGVWVNGDDGVIRGVEAKTGKVTALLKDGHQVGCKVRTIWAGWVSVRRGEETVREEWLVSGGFDKKLIVWRGPDT